MQKNNFSFLFSKLFGVDITSSLYRNFEYTKDFEKKLSKLKGKEAYNLLNKMLEILATPDVTRYKNLRHDLKKYRRVHVNGSYVILFYDDKNKKVYFVDYEHHDRVYKSSKKSS